MFKKENPKTSIIMNCHNGEKFLHESINSVLKQSYDNWELIFYDNCSTDKSLSIIKSFNDQRIKVYKSKSFLNLYHARNEAIKKINGKYVCFLDTDDYWTKDKVEQQVEFLETNKQYSMVYSNYYLLDEKKKIKNVYFKFILPEGRITKKILKKYTIGILTTCIKSEVFKSKKFNDKFNIIGDFDFFVNLSTTLNIGSIQDPLAFYREHESNYSKKNMKTHIEELKEWIETNKLKFKILGFSLYYQKLLLLKLTIKHLLGRLGV